jgi:uncharacterized protein YggU (UPF0235/DUF167 family)
MQPLFTPDEGEANNSLLTYFRKELGSSLNLDLTLIPSAIGIEAS